jgi:hypothetical protein
MWLCHHDRMETNVSTLLRDFPRIRRAALSGQRVMVHTREGDLLITRAPSAEQTVLGCMRGTLAASADDLDQPTSSTDEWKVAL